jgi:hypothetical protein
MRIYSKQRYEQEAQEQTWKVSLDRILLGRGYKHDDNDGYFLLDKECGQHHHDRMEIKQIGRFAIQIALDDSHFIREAEGIACELESEGYYVELMVPDAKPVAAEGDPEAQPTELNPQPSIATRTLDAVDPEDLTQFLKERGWKPWIHTIGELSFDKTDDLGAYRITIPPNWMQGAYWGEAREKFIGQIAIIEDLPREEIEQALISIVAARLAAQDATVPEQKAEECGGGSSAAV